MMVVTHLDPNTEVHQKTPRGYGGNLGVGGVIPHHTTLMSPLSNMAEMDQITGRLSFLDQCPALPLKLIKPNHSTHCDMGWGCASWGATPKSWQGHLKVTARSNQPKLAKIAYFCSFCYNYVHLRCL